MTEHRKAAGEPLAGVLFAGKVENLTRLVPEGLAVVNDSLRIEATKIIQVAFESRYAVIEQTLSKLGRLFVGLTPKDGTSPTLATAAKEAVDMILANFRNAGQYAGRTVSVYAATSPRSDSHNQIHIVVVGHALDLPTTDLVGTTHI